MNMDRITQESVAIRAGIIKKTFLAVAIFAAAANGEALARDNAQGPTDCPAIGDTCADGTVYAGVSPAGDAFLFTTPADASSAMAWNKAVAYAEQLEANGHDDWRLPTGAELFVLYDNRNVGALNGTFNETDSRPEDWHWSSTELSYDVDYVYQLRFSDGFEFCFRKDKDGLVRPVRSEPRP